MVKNMKMRTSVFYVLFISSALLSGSQVCAAVPGKSGGHSRDATAHPEAEAVKDGSLYDLSIIPQFQRATRAGENNANYEIDFVGLKRFYQGKPDNVTGDGGLAWWALYNATISEIPTSELSQEAGLLWDPNDGDAPKKGTGAFGVITWWQQFLDNQLTLFAGKNYPGLHYAESDYYGDDRATFYSTFLAGDQAGRYYKNIGLGLHLKYQPGDWFVQGSFTDAKAKSKFIDIDSIKDGKFLWAFEAGYNPRRDNGVTNITVMPYTIDNTGSLTREKGLVLAFTHEFGNQAEYAVFGRYTFRKGGEGITALDQASELPLINGGFIGFALNKPFGFENQQISAALMYGKATESRKSAGFNNQYGMEVYWKFHPTDWLNITPDMQFVRNSQNQVEFIPGFRFKVYKVW